MTYDDKQVNDFVELAQEIGITRAKRELGYPKHWNTGKSWCDNRGVEVPIDEIKAKAAATREWYKDEDVLEVAQQGFSRVYEELTNNSDLSPDDQKKLSEAAKKYYDMYASLKGKATNITENRASDAMDAHLEDLLRMERAKNMLRTEEVTDK